MPRHMSSRDRQTGHAYVTELKQRVRNLVGRLEKSATTPVEQDNFVIAFKATFDLVSSKNDFNEIMEIYHVASRFIPSLHIHVGSLLARLGLIEEAMACFRCGVEAIPDDLSAVYQLEDACCTLVERWHFSMLNDLRRNANYRETISSAIALGHRQVLDIGTGTGLLACFCCQSNSEKPVYACDDSTTMCAIASAVFSRNNLSSNQVKLIKIRSTELSVPRDLPQRVSLVVTEIFDAALFGEGVLKTLQHAWRELLLPPKPVDATQTPSSDFGLVIPARASVYVCAIESRAIRSENRLLVGGAYRHLSSSGFVNFSAVSRTNFCDNNCEIADDLSDSSNPDDALFENYTTERLVSIRDGFTQLSEEFALLNVNFNDPSQINSLISQFSLSFELVIKKQGILDAIACWFDLDLSDDKVKRAIGNRPNAIQSCWEQAIFPVLPSHLPGEQMSFFVEPGDVLKLKARLDDEGSRLHIRCVDVVRHASKHLVVGNIERPITLPFSRSSIRYLNDGEYNFAFSRLLECAHNVFGFNSVLILSPVPTFLSLQAAYIGYQRVVHLVRHSSDALSLSAFASKLQAVTTEKKAWSTPSFVVGSVEQLTDSLNGQPSDGFDLIISELVEPYGVLRQQSVEELQLAKMTLLSTRTALAIPSRLRIYGMFIEADELFEQAAVAKGSNDGVECVSSCRCVRTCQVHVADFLNLYRVRTQINVDMHALKYRSLSEKFIIFDIDLNEQKAGDDPSQPSWLKNVVELQIAVTATGRLAGLLFWFENDLVDSSTAKKLTESPSHDNHVPNMNTIFTFNTSRASSHFRHAAILVPEDRPLSVISGYLLKTRFVFHNSCLNFSFLSTERTSAAPSLWE